LNAILRFGPRSLSGVRLEGRNAVRLIYIDEAGISNPTHEPWVVVAGVIIHGDDKLNGVKNALEALMHRTIPRRHHEDFVFHAKELFNGGGKVFKREKKEFIGPPEWPLDRRLDIASQLARIFKKFRLPIALGFIERETLPKALILPIEDNKPCTTVSAHVAAYLNCGCSAEYFMRKTAPNENCLAVVEDNENARTYIRLMQQAYQNKALLAHGLIKRQYFPWRRIQEDPLFQAKRQSSPLILADFAAYVFKKNLINDVRYEKYVDEFRQDIILFDGDGAAQAAAV
jgi:hypothetical protein